MVWCWPDPQVSRLLASNMIIRVSQGNCNSPTESSYMPVIYEGKVSNTKK